MVGNWQTLLVVWQSESKRGKNVLCVFGWLRFGSPESLYQGHAMHIRGQRHNNITPCQAGLISSELQAKFNKVMKFQCPELSVSNTYRSKLCGVVAVFRKLLCNQVHDANAGLASRMPLPFVRFLRDLTFFANLANILSALSTQLTLAPVCLYVWRVACVRAIL
jgi:hypothetical protein